MVLCNTVLAGLILISTTRRNYVMLVEQKCFAKKDFVKHRDQKNQIGRIARMDDIESMPPGYLQREDEFPEESNSIFKKITNCTSTFGGQPMSINSYPVDLQSQAASFRSQANAR